MAGAVISEGAWGPAPADLWTAARVYVPALPAGLLLNIGPALPAIDAALSSGAR